MRKIAINLETQKRNASHSLPVTLKKIFRTYTSSNAIPPLPTMTTLLAVESLF
jgi:hypothetical protein